LDEKDVKSDLKIKGGYALVGVRFYNDWQINRIYKQ
jgi:hypothetical protein